jgi:hypothetical protein
MIDLNQARHERTRTIGVVLPASLVNAIEQRAKAELTGKSTWMRRVLLAELTKDQAGPAAPSKDAA